MKQQIAAKLQDEKRWIKCNRSQGRTKVKMIKGKSFDHLSKLFILTLIILSFGNN